MAALNLVDRKGRRAERQVVAIETVSGPATVAMAAMATESAQPSRWVKIPPSRRIDPSRVDLEMGCDPVDERGYKRHVVHARCLCRGVTPTVIPAGDYRHSDSTMPERLHDNAVTRQGTRQPYAKCVVIIGEM